MVCARWCVGVFIVVCDVWSVHGECHGVCAVCTVCVWCVAVVVCMCHVVCTVRTACVCGGVCVCVAWARCVVWWMEVGWEGSPPHIIAHTTRGAHAQVEHFSFFFCFSVRLPTWNLCCDSFCAPSMVQPRKRMSMRTLRISASCKVSSQPCTLRV